MANSRYPLDEKQAELQEQFPEEKLDVYFEPLDQEPDPEHVYDADPPDKVVISLSNKQYASMTEAKARLAALLAHRKLRCYRDFKTARFFVFYCVPL